MFSNLNWDAIKGLLTKANPHELIYFAVGYWAGVHYSKQVLAWVVYALSGAGSPQ